MLTSLKEEKDGQDVVDLIYKKTKGTRIVQRIPLDLRQESACKQLVDTHIKKFGSIDSLYVIYFDGYDDILSAGCLAF